MKILHLSYHEKSGGAAIAASRIHESLIKSKINSIMLVQNKVSNSKTVISLDRKIDIFLDKLNFFFQRKLNKFNANSNTYKVSKSYNLLPTFKIKLIEEINPDIVNLHWIGNNFINFKEISLIKKPVVWTVHDMWPYCGSEHYSFESRYIQGYKKINFPNKKKLFSFDLDKIVWQQKKKYLNKNINLVATSTWQENNLKKSYLFKNCNIQKIFYPLNIKNWNKKDKIDMRKKFNIPLNKKVLLFISEKIGNPMKGFEIIKKILKNMDNDNFFLLILGRSNTKLFNDIYIDYKFIEQIEGNAESLIDIYSVADLLLAPSQLESFGIIAQEAASCSLATIAFSGTGFEDTITHKKNGYIVKQKDLKDFAIGINWCLHKNNHYKISNAGRNIIDFKFNEKNIANDYVNYYKKLIDKNFI